MSLDFRFLEPVDVLFFRGNRLFDAAGSYSEALMPPPPSVFSGALRSFLMAERGFDPARFRTHAPDGPLRDVVGTSPTEPGTFRITLAAIGNSSGILLPLPADLVAFGEDGEPAEVHPLVPVSRKRLDPVQMSGDLPRLPVLVSKTKAKPLGGVLLDAGAIRAYQAGEGIAARGLERSTNVWKTDSRLGIGMDASSRRVKDGSLYTSDGIAFCKDWGFVTAVFGSGGLLPKQGLLRLGGDGHGASVREWTPPGQVPWTFIPKTKGFRMILATPGLFPAGWLPPGVTHLGGEDYRLEHVFADGTSLRARLAAAAVHRSEVVSGWSLAGPAGGFPKPAQKTVNPGSVYPRNGSWRG